MAVGGSPCGNRVLSAASSPSLVRFSAIQQSFVVFVDGGGGGGGVRVVAEESEMGGRGGEGEME